MSFVKKVARSSNPLKPKFSNPISAALDEKKRGGDTMSIVGAALDPGELFGNNRTLTEKESAENRAEFLAKAKKKSRGMKKGGSTNKCGVGGYYRKRK